MKNARYFLLISLWLATTFATAQQPEDPEIQVTTSAPRLASTQKIHGYLNLGFSAPLGGVIGFTMFERSGWGGSISRQLLSLESNNMPPNYSSGSGLYNIFDNSKPSIHEDYTVTAMRILKKFPTNSPKVRLSLEAGPAMVKGMVADNFRSNPEPCNIFGCPPNYLYDKVERDCIGLSLAGKLEFPLARAFGLEIGVNAEVNRLRKFVSMAYLITIGSVRDAKK